VRYVSLVARTFQSEVGVTFNLRDASLRFDSRNFAYYLPRYIRNRVNYYLLGDGQLFQA
jgi:hypothetical protein